MAKSNIMNSYLLNVTINYIESETKYVYYPLSPANIFHTVPLRFMKVYFKHTNSLVL